MPNVNVFDMAGKPVFSAMLRGIPLTDFFVDVILPHALIDHTQAVVDVAMSHSNTIGVAAFTGAAAIFIVIRYTPVIGNIILGFTFCQCANRMQTFVSHIAIHRRYV